MSRHKAETISGLLDGELKGIRRWFVERHVRACPLCAVEYRRQRQVRRMLQGHPPMVQMSDPPDFFWLKVKTEIKRRGERRIKLPIPKLVLPDWLRQYQFAVATAATLVVVTLSGIWLTQTPTPSPVRVVSAPVPVSFAKVEQLKTAIPNTVATAFESEDAQVTVIWVSGLPWTPDLNEMKTEFANLDT